MAEGNEDDNDGKKLTPTEMAIIEMMKQQNEQAQQSQRSEQTQSQKHAFWDTQVNLLYPG